MITGMAKSFSERLAEAVRAKKTPVMVGLDPRWELLPEVFTEGKDPSDRASVAEAFELFCRAVIDIVAPMVPIVKPQAAFFEQYGPVGMLTLGKVIRYARSKGLLVLLDGKRNDIGSTAQAYAAGLLGEHSPWGADALTVNPYLGGDSLEPFITAAKQRAAGIFILVKTSNPGGGLFQDLIADGKPLYRHVADYIASLSSGLGGYGEVGAVVGATWPEQLAELREAMPNSWLLIPGYGSQGGAAEDVAAAFDADGLGAVINNSRGILFAHRRKEYEEYGSARWEKAVEAAAGAMIAALAEGTRAGRLK